MISQLTYNNIDTVYVCGDVHGYFDPILSFLKKIRATDSIFIIAGDAGIGFSSREGDIMSMRKLKDYCVNNNVVVLCVRGNHDNPQFYRDHVIDEPWIKLLEDYTLISVTLKDGKSGRILTVGGGVSIDRVYRKMKHERQVAMYAETHLGMPMETVLERVHELWWQDEKPVYDEEKLSHIGRDVYAVITHTCPSFVGLKDKEILYYWFSKDPELSDDLDYERSTMDKIYRYLHAGGNVVSEWYYGHFHKHMVEEVNGTTFTMLDMERNGKIDVGEIKFDKRNDTEEF